MGEMQKVLRDTYDGEIHISTGMSTKEEIEQIVTFWEQGKGRAKDRLVLYNCTSGYPVPFEDVCLLDIRLLQQKYAHRVHAIWQPCSPSCTASRKSLQRSVATTRVRFR